MTDRYWDKARETAADVAAWPDWKKADAARIAHPYREADSLAAKEREIEALKRRVDEVERERDDAENRLFWEKEKHPHLLWGIVRDIGQIFGAIVAFKEVVAHWRKERARSRD